MRQTIIRDPRSSGVVVGGQKKSAGGTASVIRTREPPLGCCSPFSTPDVRTPFRVFIARDKSLKEPEILNSALTPTDEKKF